ncbi:hypothetical protein M8C21_012845, partial [Ambrosia artemisiifolia]
VSSKHTIQSTPHYPPPSSLSLSLIQDLGFPSPSYSFTAIQDLELGSGSIYFEVLADRTPNAHLWSKVLQDWEGVIVFMKTSGAIGERFIKASNIN